jgi:hypothetical protein
MNPAMTEVAGALGAAAWMERNLLQSAEELARAGRSSLRFLQGVSESLRKYPIETWEADRWLRGMKLRLVRMEAFFFRAGTQKRAAVSLFVRNDHGLNVGLRREAITQMATFVSLVTDFGYRRSQTRFESRFMDVLVLDAGDRAWIYAENKASGKTLEKLCARLSAEFADYVPVLSGEEEIRGVDDAVMKANHIWKHRPVYFWGVSPSVRRAFRVLYEDRGFRLQEIERIPHADEMPAAALF